MPVTVVVRPPLSVMTHCSVALAEPLPYLLYECETVQLWLAAPAREHAFGLLVNDH